MLFLQDPRVQVSSLTHVLCVIRNWPCCVRYYQCNSWKKHPFNKWLTCLTWLGLNAIAPCRYFLMPAEYKVTNLRYYMYLVMHVCAYASARVRGWEGCGGVGMAGWMKMLLSVYVITVILMLKVSRFKFTDWCIFCSSCLVCRCLVVDFKCCVSCPSHFDGWK